MIYDILFASVTRNRKKRQFIPGPGHILGYGSEMDLAVVAGITMVFNIHPFSLFK